MAAAAKPKTKARAGTGVRKAGSPGANARSAVLAPAPAQQPPPPPARTAAHEAAICPETLLKCLRFHVEERIPAMVWGPPGIGKSEIVASIVDDYNVHGTLHPPPPLEGAEPKRRKGAGSALLVDLRLAQYESGDIKGIPFPDPKTSKMDWWEPKDLPSEELAAEHDLVILFLDEINGAIPQVQGAAYQLILDRRIGTYRLPDNVAIVAAGNHESDRGVTYRMPNPLVNRMGHFCLGFSAESFVEHGIVRGFHRAVLAYISFAPHDLHRADPASPSKAFPSPRSWKRVSDILLAIEKGGGDWTDSEIDVMVEAHVGRGAAVPFSAHRRYYRNLPTPDDILEGRVKSLGAEADGDLSVSARYAMIASLGHRLAALSGEHAKGAVGKEDMARMTENALSFAMGNFASGRGGKFQGAEMVLLLVKILMARRSSLASLFLEIARSDPSGTSEVNRFIKPGSGGFC